jgi:beta-lactamase regulating signal transducer with metallopeptidase domain
MNAVQLLAALGIWTAKSLALILIAFVVTRFVRRSAAVRHAIWLAALAAILTLPLLTFVVPAKAIAVPVYHDPAAAPVAYSDIEFLPALDASSDVSTEASPAPILPPAPTHLDYPLMALSVWVLGASLLGVTAFCGLIAVERLRRRSDDRPISDAVAGFAAQLRVRRRWQLRTSPAPQPDTALTWGTLRPVVLLPRHSDEWSDDRFEAVLLHELAHVHRCDSLSQLVGFAACALFWFNPAAWLAARATRSEAEKAADDAVLQAGMTPSRYAEELVRYAAALGRRRYPILSLGASFMKPSKLENRVRSIVNPANRRRGVSSVEALAVATLGMGAAFLIASLKPYPTVLEGLNDQSGPAVTVAVDQSQNRKSPTTPVVIQDKASVTKKKKLAAEKRARLKAIVKKLAAIEAKQRRSRSAELTKAEIAAIKAERVELGKILQESPGRQVNGNGIPNVIAIAPGVQLDAKALQQLMATAQGMKMMAPGAGAKPFGSNGWMSAAKRWQELKGVPFQSMPGFEKLKAKPWMGFDPSKFQVGIPPQLLKELKSMGTDRSGNVMTPEEAKKWMELLGKAGMANWFGASTKPGDMKRWMGSSGWPSAANPFGSSAKPGDMKKWMESSGWPGAANPFGSSAKPGEMKKWMESSGWPGNANPFKMGAYDPAKQKEVLKQTQAALERARAAMAAGGKSTKDQAEINAKIEEIVRELSNVDKKLFISSQTAELAGAQKAYEESVRQMNAAVQKMREAEAELKRAELDTTAKAKQAATQKKKPKP